MPKSAQELPPLEELAEIVRRIGVPFFTMDIAQTEDNDWIVMEIGDGQVSAFPQMPGDAERFYPALEPILEHQHVPPPEPPPLTQRAFDQMTCDDPGCDHKAHSTAMVVRPRCHMGAPVRVTYENGVVTIICAECRSLVARVAVDPGDVVRH